MYVHCKAGRSRSVVAAMTRSLLASEARELGRRDRDRRRRRRAKWPGTQAAASSWGSTTLSSTSQEDEEGLVVGQYIEVIGAEGRCRDVRRAPVDDMTLQPI
ncbi:hypothetical protein V8B97DRAFT_517721 [Scleroderma yunnanense]